MKNSSSYADKITRQDMKEAVDFLNSIGVGTFTFYESNDEYIHRIKDEHSNTILIGNTKRELYGKIQAFIRGIHYNEYLEEREEDEDREARDYEGGKEDYLYDNYVAEQLEREDK